MKKSAVLMSVFLILFLQLVSASIVISEQPKDLYNYGETIKIPVKIIAENNINNYLSVNLICDGKSMEVGKESVFLLTGQEKSSAYFIPLTKNIVENFSGKCAVDFNLGAETASTNNFAISNLINIKLTQVNTTINPGDKIIIQGTATKENSNNVNGFVEIKIDNSDLNENIDSMNIVKDGKFNFNFSLPKYTKARRYTALVNVYEKDLEGNVNNFGTTDFIVNVNQVPSSLEIILGNSSVNPDSTQEIKVILYDQAGEKINSQAKIQVRNQNNKLIYEKIIDAGDVLPVAINYNEPPAKWKVSAQSGNLNQEIYFAINPRENLKTDISGNSVVFTNLGNILYTKTTTVKIGDQPFEISLNLKPGESETYVLTAPSGEYNVESNGIAQKLTLTGNAVDISKVSDSVLSFVQTGVGNYLIWGFIFIILILAIFIIVKRLWKRKIFAYKASRYHSKETYIPPVRKKDLSLEIQNKAEMSISLKGESMPSTAVCVKIKNMNRMLNPEGIKETMQKAVDIAEMNKAYTYESHDGIVFLFVPFKTKTMQNEKTASGVAERIRDVLAYHNKVYKDKIDYGIGVEDGQIIGKNRPGIGLAFTPLQNFFVNVKKLASNSRGEVIIGENAKGKTSGITHSQNTDTKKFMDDFSRRNKFSK